MRQRLDKLEAEKKIKLFIDIIIINKYKNGLDSLEGCKV